MYRLRKSLIKMFKNRNAAFLPVPSPHLPAETPEDGEDTGTMSPDDESDRFAPVDFDTPAEDIPETASDDEPEAAPDDEPEAASDDELLDFEDDASPEDTEAAARRNPRPTPTTIRIR